MNAKQTSPAPTVSSERLLAEPPNADEIHFWATVMQDADRILGRVREGRGYTTAEVISSLTAMMPDSGGTPLGELRALKLIFLYTPARRANVRGEP